MIIVADSDGGPDDANSYLDVEKSDELADLILVDPGEWKDLDEEDKERYLILATRYVDTYLTPSSFLLEKDQPLLWPRREFTDTQGRKVNGIPEELKKATLSVATEFINNDPFEQSPRITKESFGDSSQTFAEPIRENGFKANVALQRLCKLGYGYSGNTMVRLIRG